MKGNGHVEYMQYLQDNMLHLQEKMMVGCPRKSELTGERLNSLTFQTRFSGDVFIDGRDISLGGSQPDWSGWALEPSPTPRHWPFFNQPNTCPIVSTSKLPLEINLHEGGKKDFVENRSSKWLEMNKECAFLPQRWWGLNSQLGTFRN